jgi:cell division protein FtsN
MKQQRGGTFLGFILGVVVGLAGALAVAVYVTKVPVPFMNKGQSRSADQDEAEAKRNKDWDPNAPLYGKNPAKSTATPALGGASATESAKSKDAEGSKGSESKTAAKGEPKVEVKPAVSADPLGDLAKAKMAPSPSEPFTYYVQLGAFRTAEDAETLRARLSLSGIETKVTEREQSGRVVFRVRTGPFDSKDDADRNRDKLDKAGLETSMVRVQR